MVTDAISNNESVAHNGLSRDIRLLASTLGHIIREQHGEEAFNLVEQVRLTAKARRSGDASAAADLTASIRGASLHEKNILIKAFSSYFQLINIAEDQERIRALRSREMKNMLRESIDSAIFELATAGLTAEEMRGLLDRTHIRLVLTAHPTEAKRKEILVKLRHLAQMMGRRGRHELTPSELRVLDENIGEEIEELWQTRLTRATRPTLADEVDFGIYFTTSVIMDVLVLVDDELRYSLERHYPDENWLDLPRIVQYASWIGGDRDGNPNVTPEVTLRTIETLRAAGREVYLSDISFLRDHLTQSIDEIGFSAGLLEAVDSQTQGEGQYTGEIYRQMMDLILQKLYADEYARSRDLLDDLYIVENSLLENQGQRVAKGALRKLIRKVELFGLHMLPLEVRDDARDNASAVDELFHLYGIAENYLDLPEEEKQLLLTREIANHRPLFPVQAELSEAANKVINTWRMIAEAHERWGPNTIDSVIASMSKKPSDVLTLLLFASEVGVSNQVDLVPLFETVEDLKASADTMSTLFDNSEYGRYLNTRGMRQQIMVGYSDSSKDGGYMASRWGLYEAQRNLADMCRKRGVMLEVFHGRGGSIGRGGGPTNLAIRSQPPSSVVGPIRITEQGEVIAYRYNNSSIARRHLHQIIHATLLAVGLPADSDVQDSWRDTMREIAEASEKEYRNFVYETPGFLEYWRQATPINELNFLHIGSRPTKRRTGGFESIRAIPWVFSWMQSRAIIPSWYGIGTGLNNIYTNDGGVETLQSMYQDWPFFTTLIDNAELDLVKADMGIAELYASLVDDGDIRERLYSRMKAEHELASRMISSITGQERLLSRVSWLDRSINRRNPYVDPLNFIQVELLKTLRSMDADHPEYNEMLRAVLSTVNGIAAGLKTTG